MTDVEAWRAWRRRVRDLVTVAVLQPPIPARSPGVNAAAKVPPETVPVAVIGVAWACPLRVTVTCWPSAPVAVPSTVMPAACSAMLRMSSEPTPVSVIAMVGAVTSMSKLSVAGVAGLPAASETSAVTVAVLQPPIPARSPGVNAAAKVPPETVPVAVIGVAWACPLRVTVTCWPSAPVAVPSTVMPAACSAMLSVSSGPTPVSSMVIDGAVKSAVRGADACGASVSPSETSAVTVTVAPSAGRAGSPRGTVSDQLPSAFVGTVGSAVPSILTSTGCPAGTLLVMPEMVMPPGSLLSAMLITLSSAMSSMVIEGPLKSALTVRMAGLSAGLPAASATVATTATLACPSIASASTASTAGCGTVTVQAFGSAPLPPPEPTLPVKSCPSKVTVTSVAGLGVGGPGDLEIALRVEKADPVVAGDIIERNGGRGEVEGDGRGGVVGVAGGVLDRGGDGDIRCRRVEPREAARGDVDAPGAIAHGAGEVRAVEGHGHGLAVLGIRGARHGDAGVLFREVERAVPAKAGDLVDGNGRRDRVDDDVLRRRVDLLALRVARGDGDGDPALRDVFGGKGKRPCALGVDLPHAGRLVAVRIGDGHLHGCGALGQGDPGIVAADAAARRERRGVYDRQGGGVAATSATAAGSGKGARADAGSDDRTGACPGPATAAGGHDLGGDLLDARAHEHVAIRRDLDIRGRYGDRRAVGHDQLRGAVGHRPDIGHAVDPRGADDALGRLRGGDHRQGQERADEAAARERARFDPPRDPVPNIGFPVAFSGYAGSRIVRSGNLVCHGSLAGSASG